MSTIAASHADGSELLEWAAAATRALEARCEEINDLNLFPIPDADTGTNMLFTMRSALAAAQTADDGAGAPEVAARLARGAVAGARGNSGVILSQVLRGIAGAWQAEHAGPAGRMAAALASGVRLVTAALSAPVEGTILTVLRRAAQAVGQLRGGEPLGTAASVAADAAADALKDTTSQLPVLGEAGVVDAGALGLVIILDSLAQTLTGRAPVRERPATRAPQPGLCPTDIAESHSASREFEVMYLVGSTDAQRMARLRASLERLGDSVVIVSDGQGSWSVHSHVDDAGAAVEAGLDAGRVHQIRITSFAADAQRKAAKIPTAALSAPPTGATQPRTVLALVDGDDAAVLFAAEGAAVLRAPVTREALRAAVRAVGSEQVIVLPNGIAPRSAVAAVARRKSAQIEAVPSQSMVQGLAALAVHGPELDFDADVRAMSDAAAGTCWGSVLIDKAGRFAAKLGGKTVSCADDPPLSAASASRALIETALDGGGELVTLLIGADAEDGLGEHLCEHVAQMHPGVDVMVYHGGQAGEILQLGVE